MPSYHPSLSPELAEWCLQQSLFFTASAPLVGKHINVSPKGLPSSSFAVLGPNQVAYIDVTGSGCETISHLYENGRVTIMFNSFDRSPRIVRLFCTGRVVESDRPEFETLRLKMGSGKSMPGARAIILLDIWKVQSTCGFGVPLLSTTETKDGKARAVLNDRDTMSNWAEKAGKKGELEPYRAEWNSRSLDGLPGMKSARRGNGENLLWVEDTKAWLKRATISWDTLFFGVVMGALVGAMGSKSLLG